MKRLLLFSGYLLFHLSGIVAQTILTKNQVPKIGEVIYISSVTLQQEMPVEKFGIGQSWDFSFLGEQRHDSIRFLNPIQTEGHDSFITADYALDVSYISAEPDFKYFSIGDSGIFQLGEYHDPQLFVLESSVMKPPFMEMKFPFSYGDLFKSTSYYDLLPYRSDTVTYDSIFNRIYHSITDHVIATGTLKVKAGSFEEVLLVKRINFDSAGQYIKNASTNWQWEPYSADTTAQPCVVYLWYIKNCTYPYAEYNPQSAITPWGPVVRQAKSHYLYTNTGLINARIGLSIFPNPTESKIVIRNLSNPMEYVITNSIGQKVLQGVVEPFDPSMNILTLPKGTYFLCLFNGEFLQTLRLIKN